jgi:hypothetical protein
MMYKPQFLNMVLGLPYMIYNDERVLSLKEGKDAQEYQSL